jgi:hypothetical protein
MTPGLGKCFFTIMVPGERTHKGAKRYIPRRPTLENHFRRIRLTRQAIASAEIKGLESGKAPQVARIWALRGVGLGIEPLHVTSGPDWRGACTRTTCDRTHRQVHALVTGLALRAADP